MSNLVGKRILHYKIIEQIGQGGMGVVYLAEDSRLERKVAIKFLPHHISDNSEERKRFEIEAKAAAALNHPNIATIHAIEETDDQIFLVMEYIEGKELKEMINTPLSPPFIRGEEKGANGLKGLLEIAVQIAEGLHAAHKKGIVHRDIKSGNIMITSEDKVKIMDFGLAKFRDSEQTTESSTTMGTAAYMSPEQARGEDADEQSDIWSFGVVLYEMLTNTLPFKGDYEQAIIYSILNEEPENPKTINNEIPNEICEIVLKCLNKDSKLRYDSLNEIISELNKLNATKSQIDFSTFKKPRFFIPLIVVLLVIIYLSYSYITQSQKEKWARTEILPQIENLVREMQGTERKLAWRAFELSRQIKNIIPDDPILKSLKKEFQRALYISSYPSGADIYGKAYADSGQAWHFFGTTPLDSISFPVGFSRIKIQKDGYRSGFDIVWNASYLNDSLEYKIIENKKIPEKMELVYNEANWYNIAAAPAGLHFPGLENYDFEPVGDFFMDRYEVTNQEFKKFIDDGGYRNKDFWKYPFFIDNQELEWEKAIKLFIDQTGQPGPSTWEVGDYAQGMDNFPVTGVSWYEAAAYAAYAGKSLPTVFHWDRVALTWASAAIIPQSNLTNDGLLEIGKSNSMNRFGIYDLAGNVREWCYNESSRGGKFILGGGWNDPAYGFNDSYAQSAFDRSPTNGFRCIKYIDQDLDHDALTQTIKLPYRDFLNEQTVSDATFKIFLNQYNYDKTPLNSLVEDEANYPDYIRQKVSFDAAYGAERMSAYIFLPKTGKTPYQTVIYFPGSGAIHRNSSENLQPGGRSDFITKSGRAFVWPIYKSTYERGDDLKSDYPNMTNFWKEHVMMWTKDFSRTIDYLETRPDIDNEKLAYYGASWGGAMGGIIPAVETRVKTAVLLVAGLLFQKSLPEAEPINFLPRITMPVLMLNGKYDFFFPYETSQLPFYKLLGTPQEHKKLFIYEGGHSVPKTENIKEVLAWLDNYLGPVEK